MTGRPVAFSSVWMLASRLTFKEMASPQSVTQYTLHGKALSRAAKAGVVFLVSDTTPVQGVLFPNCYSLILTCVATMHRTAVSFKATVQIVSAIPSRLPIRNKCPLLISDHATSM